MIRIGIIGSGPNGTGNAKSFAKHTERCRIAAVADPNQEAAQRLADVYGAKVFTDYASMLPEVDAVVISSPNFLHTEQALVCAAAGKHLYIEKPMALSTEDADKIVTAVDQARVGSFVGFSVRFDAITQRIIEYTRAGRIGEVFSLFSRRVSDMKIPAGSWRLDYAKSGGVLFELIAHEIDWILYLGGKPTSVYCRKTAVDPRDPRDNDHLWITLNFGEKATGTLEGSQIGKIADYYRGVLGSEGSLATRSWGNELYWQNAKGATEQVEKGDSFDKHLHFLDVVEQRCASVADVRWGRDIVFLSEKLIESAIKNQVVTL